MVRRRMVLGELRPSRNAAVQIGVYLPKLTPICPRYSRSLYVSRPRVRKNKTWLPALSNRANRDAAYDWYRYTLYHVMIPLHSWTQLVFFRVVLSLKNNYLQEKSSIFSLFASKIDVNFFFGAPGEVSQNTPTFTFWTSPQKKFEPN